MSYFVQRTYGMVRNSTIPILSYMNEDEFGCEKVYAYARPLWFADLLLGLLDASDINSFCSKLFSWMLL